MEAHVLEPSILVYDDDREQATVINQPTKAVLTRAVNGVQYLTLALPFAHPARHLLEPERWLEHEGEIYRVRRIESFRQRRTPMVEVMAEARFYDLGLGTVEPVEWTDASAGAAMTNVLSLTGWSVGTVEPTHTRTWDMEEGSPLECLRKIALAYGGDLRFDNKNRVVHLVAFDGRRNSATFTWGRGLLESRKVVDSSELFTRIWGVNTRGVTMAEANGGVPYVEDFTYTTEVRSRVMRFGPTVSPARMRSLCLAALVRLGRPKVSYELSLADLSAWSGQALDQFDAGDEILVVDDELGIRVTERIGEIERDLLRPWNTKITLAEKLAGIGTASRDGEADWTDPEILATELDQLGQDFEEFTAGLPEDLSGLLDDFDQRLTDLETSSGGGGSGGNIIAVEHGSNVDHARPEGYLVVHWYGSVVPNNKQRLDLHFNV